MPHATIKSSKRLRKPHFSSTAEVWEYLLRAEGGEQRFTREQVDALVAAIEEGRATSRVMAALSAIRAVIPELANRCGRVEVFPQVPPSPDPALARLTRLATNASPIIRGVSTALSSLDVVKDGRRLQALAGEIQMMCAFAIRTAEALNANTIQPAEMEAMALLVGYRSGSDADAFGPTAVPGKKRRANWKQAMKKARSILAWIDDFDAGEPI